MLKGGYKWRLMGLVTILALIFVGFPLWFGVTLSWPPVSDYFTVQSYHQGQCTILSKRLLESGYYNQDTGNNEYTYVPDFTFLVQDATHKSYQAEGYGVDQHQAQQQEAQAILDSYHTSGSYSCWYDPANLSHAVLTREVANWALLIPGVILLLVALGILVGASLITRWLLR